MATLFARPALAFARASTVFGSVAQSVPGGSWAARLRDSQLAVPASVAWASFCDPLRIARSHATVGSAAEARGAERHDQAARTPRTSTVVEMRIAHSLRTCSVHVAFGTGVTPSAATASLRVQVKAWT